MAGECAGRRSSAARPGGVITVELLRARAGDNETAILAYEARRPRGVTIVAGHGYSSSKQNLDSLCAFLASHGFDIYSLDFPGHKLGASGGRLSSVDDLLRAFGATVEAARGAAARDPAISGAISIATGLGRPVALAALSGRGVVDLRSSYVDGLGLAEIAAAWEPILAPALAQLAGRPTLFIAAEADGLVSPASVRELFERAPEPKSFASVPGNHTYAGENSRSAILTWLGDRHARPPLAALDEAAL